MPSMKCHECKKVAKCSAIAQGDETGRAVLVYYCAPCRREYIQDLKDAIGTEEGGEA
jgi:hypothetical protein